MSRVEKIKQVKAGATPVVQKIKPAQKPVKSPAKPQAKQLVPPAAESQLRKVSRSYGTGTGDVEELMEAANNANPLD